MYNMARRILEKRGLTVARSLVGSYVTSLEMAGCSITLTQLNQKLTTLWDDAVHTAALRW
jgi:dihydroxyacetone kinase-like protein